MPSVMQERSSRRWSTGSIVFTAVAAISLGSAIVSVGLGSHQYSRFDHARAKVAAEKSSLARRGGATKLDARGSQPASLFGEFRVARADLARGDAASLRRVLDRADAVDRQHTFVASVIAAKLIDGVVARIDAEPSLLEDEALRAAIRSTSFASSRRPFESERIHAMSRLAEVPSQVPFRTAGFVQHATTEAMEDVDATMREMEASVLAGDERRCEEVAERPKGLAKQVTVGPSMCRNAQQIFESGKRLERVQARAAAASRHPRMLYARTARPR